MFVALLMAGCGGEVDSGSDGSESHQSSSKTPAVKTAEVPKIDLDDKETLDKIIAEAIDVGKLELRGKQGEELPYAPDQQTPYSGWVKVMYGNGQIEALSPHKDGKQDGLETGWWENGQKSAETTYKDGKLDGPATTWYESGQKEAKSTLKNGIIMTLVVWKPNGEKCPVSNVDKDGNEVVVLYNDDGSEYTRTTYKDSEPVSN